MTIDGLRAIDVLAIVRPVGQPITNTRSGERWATQTFEVISSRQKLTPPRLRVSVPRELSGTRIGPLGEYNAPPPGDYLLLAMKPRAGRLSPDPTIRGSEILFAPPEIADDKTISAMQDEVKGVMLIRTDLCQLPSAPSEEGAILRAVALSAPLSEARPYGMIPFWNSIMPITTASWEGVELEECSERDVIEGLPATEFYSRVLAPLLRAPEAKGQVGNVDFWALRTRWGVEGAATQLVHAMQDLVDAGKDTELDANGSPLLDLGNSEYPARVGLPQKAMFEIATKSKSSFLRNIALKYVFNAPDLEEQKRLRPLLDDPLVRRQLMSMLANWNKKPELAPPTREQEYMTREAELVAAWKAWLDPNSNTE